MTKWPVKHFLHLLHLTQKRWNEIEHKSIKKRLLNEDSFSDFYSNPKTSTHTTNIIKCGASDKAHTCRSSDHLWQVQLKHNTLSDNYSYLCSTAHLHIYKSNEQWAGKALRRRAVTWRMKVRMAVRWAIHSAATCPATADGYLQHPTNTPISRQPVDA